MQITDNFSLQEFEYSDTALSKGIDNSIPQEAIAKIRALCVNIMQPLRDKLGVLNLTSGYRSPELNATIKGSRTSQHMKGEAADFRAKNYATRDLYEIIKKLNLDYDQLIYEKRTKNGKVIEWIHISFTTKRDNRRQAFEVIK